GDAFYLPPGHIPKAEAGTEYVRLQLRARAELDVFRAGLRLRDVPGWQVEGVSGLDDLVVVPEAECHAPLEHIAPVGARAVVVRQALHDRGRVDVVAEGHEVDRVAVDVLVAILDRADVLDVRGALLRYLRHGSSPWLDAGPRLGSGEPAGMRRSPHLSRRLREQRAEAQVVREPCELVVAGPGFVALRGVEDTRQQSEIAGAVEEDAGFAQNPVDGEIDVLLLDQRLVPGRRRRLLRAPGATR